MQRNDSGVTRECRQVALSGKGLCGERFTTSDDLDLHVRDMHMLPGATREAADLCRCEHRDHFDQGPDHAFEDVLATAAVTTLYGRYRVCAACRSAGHMQRAA